MDAHLQTPMVLGEPSMDKEHLELHSIVSNLIRGIESGQSMRQLLSLLEWLRTKTALHFGHEERMMARHGYPDTQEHIQAHSRLLHEIDKLLEGMKAGELMFSPDMPHTLYHWVANHIVTMDRHLAEFLQTCTNDTPHP